MPKVTLQPAQVADLAFITSCAESTYSIYVERIGKKPAPMVANFAAALEAGQLEILLAENSTIGFLVSFPIDNKLFIENIAIHPDHQGRGYAGEIFSLLEARARSSDMSAIELYTNEKMTENLTLYPRLGFEEIDRRSEAGFNRIYFRKTLD